MKKTRSKPYKLQKTRPQPYIQQKTTKDLLCIVNLKLRKGGQVHTLQEEDELTEPKVVLLPRPRLFSRIGQGHVELHILDLPITQAVDQVVDLNTGDLPVSDKGHLIVGELMKALRQPDHLQAVLFELHILDLILHHGLLLGGFLRPFNHKLRGPP